MPARTVPAVVQGRARLVAVLCLVCCACLLVGGVLAAQVLTRDDDAGWATGPPTDQQSVDALTAVGRQAFDAGDLESAADAFAAALGIAPKDARSLFNLGTVRAAQGEPAEAVTLLSGAVTADPSLVDAQYNLGVAAAAAGDGATARSAYEAVLQARPGDANASWNLGLLLYEDGRVGRARSLLRDAVAADPALAARLPAGVTLGS